MSRPASRSCVIYRSPSQILPQLMTATKLENITRHTKTASFASCRQGRACLVSHRHFQLGPRFMPVSDERYGSSSHPWGQMSQSREPYDLGGRRSYARGSSREESGRIARLAARMTSATSLQTVPIDQSSAVGYGEMLKK